MPPERVPQGTVLEIDGAAYYVGPYVGGIDCYRLGAKSAGAQGGPAGARLVEDVWRRTSTARLRELREQWA